MAWLYLPEQGLLNSDSPNGCEPSAMSSTTSTQLAFSLLESEADTSMMPLSGMTLRRSTGAHGEEPWTSSLRAFPARISALREAVQVWEEAAPVFSSRSCGWPKKSGPRSYSLRTPLPSEHADSTLLGKNWPIWGSIVGGVLYPLRKLEPLNSGSAGSAWPTPTVMGNGNRADYGAKSGDGLSTSALRWPTPRARDYKGPDFERGNRPAAHSGNDLPTAAAMWPTPSAAAATQGQNEADGKRGQTLIGAARGQMWPTPNAGDGPKGSPTMKFAGGNPGLPMAAARWATPKASPSGPDFARAARPKSGGDDLATQVTRWATPISRDYRSVEASPETHAKNSRPLSEQAGLVTSSGQLSHLTPTTETVGASISPGSRVLNPSFVEVLMGLPIGWTVLPPWATEWFLARPERPLWRSSRGKNR